MTRTTRGGSFIGVPISSRAAANNNNDDEGSGWWLWLLLLLLLLLLCCCCIFCFCCRKGGKGADAGEDDGDIVLMVGPQGAQKGIIEDVTGAEKDRSAAFYNDDVDTEQGLSSAVF